MTTALLLSVLIGVVAGLRSMTAPAAVSWAARAGWLNLAPTGLAFLGSAITPWILTALALGELVTDQLPTTPSRTVPAAVRRAHRHGGLLGRGDRRHAAERSSPALIAGIVGAVIGTLWRTCGSGAAGRRIRRAIAGGAHRGRRGDRRRFPDHVGIAMTRLRRHHHRGRPGRPIARRPADRAPA